MKTLCCLLVIFGLTSLAPAADTSAPPANAQWPQFRGPQANGLSPSTTLPTEWSATKNIAWRADVTGLGWSSPIVWGDKIFLTTASRVAGDEKPQMGLYLGKSRGDGEHRFLVLCYDFASGKKLWEREVHRGVPQAIHLKNSFASATAVCDGERLVALFHDVGLFAFDHDGKPLWSVPVPVRKTLAAFGHGSSPTLHDGRVFLVADNAEDSFAAAYDAASGKELWRVKRPTEMNYATPFVWRQPASGPQLIVPATKRTVAYDLAGQEVWSFSGGMSKLTICTPFAAHGMLYVGSGYFQDPVRGLFAIKPESRGDITLRDGETSNGSIAWANLKAAPYNTTPLVFGDYLYVLYDQGMLSCFDARTGKALYEKQRIGGGFTASPWAHDEKIFCLNENAETLVVQAGPEFKLINRNELEPEPCLATPALVGDSVILRTASHLYRIRAQSPVEKN